MDPLFWAKQAHATQLLLGCGGHHTVPQQSAELDKVVFSICLLGGPADSVLESFNPGPDTITIPAREHEGT